MPVKVLNRPVSEFLEKVREKSVRQLNEQPPADASIDLIEDGADELRIAKAVSRRDLAKDTTFRELHREYLVSSHRHGFAGTLSYLAGIACVGAIDFVAPLILKNEAVLSNTLLVGNFVLGVALCNGVYNSICSVTDSKVAQSLLRQRKLLREESGVKQNATPSIVEYARALFKAKAEREKSERYPFENGIKGHVSSLMDVLLSHLQNWRARGAALQGPARAKRLRSCDKDEKILLRVKTLTKETTLHQAIESGNRAGRNANLLAWGALGTLLATAVLPFLSIPAAIATAIVFPGLAYESRREGKKEFPQAEFDDLLARWGSAVLAKENQQQSLPTKI